MTLLPRGIVEPAARAGRVALHALPPVESRAESLFIRRPDTVATSALSALVERARQFAMPAEAAE